MLAVFEQLLRVPNDTYTLSRLSRPKKYAMLLIFPKQRLRLQSKWLNKFFNKTHLVIS